MSNFYATTSKTGGGLGALDAIDGASLAAGDYAFVGISAGTGIWYVLLNDGATADGDVIITPTTNAGSKRWHKTSTEAHSINLDTGQRYKIGGVNLTYSDVNAQPLTTILTTFGNLANATGYLYNNGSGVLSYAAASGSSITRTTEYFDAGRFVPGTCTGLLQYTTGNSGIFDYLQFDGATDQTAYLKWYPPDDWDASTIKVKFHWTAGASMTNAQTVIWGLMGYAAGDGDTDNVAFSAGEQTASDTYATGDETGPIQKISPATAALTIQGTPAAGKLVLFKLRRSAATDTSTANAWLTGITLQYGLTGSNPAAW